MTTTYTCHNCNGKGRIAHFAHRHSGICYACNGCGSLTTVADVNGPTLLIEVFDNGTTYGLSEELVWLWILPHDVYYDCNVSETAFRMGRDRKSALNAAAAKVTQQGGTYHDQWFRIIEFATSCWAAGEAVVERGLKAVEREHGGEWVQKYHDAIAKLRAEGGQP